MGYSIWVLGSTAAILTLIGLLMKRENLTEEV